MADLSSPLSSAPVRLDSDSATNAPNDNTSASEHTPEPRSDRTDPDFTPATPEEDDDIWQAGSSRQADAEMRDTDVEDEAPVKKRKTAAKKMGGPKNLYPDGLQRLTRLGKNTYGINTGPLSDDTNWDEVAFSVIKEQLNMRGVSSSGTKAILIDRLKNWQSFKEEQPTIELDYEPAFECNPADTEVPAVSAGNKKLSQRINDKTLAAAEKIKGELMYLLRRENLSWETNSATGKDIIASATFTILSSSGTTYAIGIGKSHTCGCTAKTYNPSGHCKHILYVLIYILRAPHALVQLTELNPQMVDMILQHGYDHRPTQAQIDADPSMKDGIPKDKTGSNCPFCFKPLGEEQSVCCNTCGRHTHHNCFALWASTNPWGVKCLVCKSAWGQDIPEKLEDVTPAKKKRGPTRKADDEEDRKR